MTVCDRVLWAQWGRRGPRQQRLRQLWQFRKGAQCWSIGSTDQAIPLGSGAHAWSAGGCAAGWLCSCARAEQPLLAAASAPSALRRRRRLGSKWEAARRLAPGAAATRRERGEHGVRAAAPGVESCLARRSVGCGARAWPGPEPGVSKGGAPPGAELSRVARRSSARLGAGRCCRGRRRVDSSLEGMGACRESEDRPRNGLLQHVVPAGRASVHVADWGWWAACDRRNWSPHGGGALGVDGGAAGGKSLMAWGWGSDQGPRWAKSPAGRVGCVHRGVAAGGWDDRAGSEMGCHACQARV